MITPVVNLVLQYEGLPYVQMVLTSKITLQITE